VPEPAGEVAVAAPVEVPAGVLCALPVEASEVAEPLLGTPAGVLPAPPLTALSSVAARAAAVGSEALTCPAVEVAPLDVPLVPMPAAGRSGRRTSR
jgi:hypothetical protein